MISCDLHDCVEIVCMYRYPIRLILNPSAKDNSVFYGIACDTARNNIGEECIKISVDGVEKLIVLDEVAKMEVLVDNPHFQQIIFNLKN